MVPSMTPEHGFAPEQRRKPTSEPSERVMPPKGLLCTIGTQARRTAGLSASQIQSSTA